MRAIVAVVAALVVVGAGVPLVAASGGGSPAFDSATAATPATLDTPDSGTENGSENASIPPGARLAGVVNVQAAEVEGEVQRRSFGLQMAAARSDGSKAAVVAAQAGDLTETLAELQERKRALVEAKRNGSISKARFRAEMAGLAAEISTARRLSNVTANTAGELPQAELEASGVSVTALEKLRANASALSGPEVSSIARSIAGVSTNASGAPTFGLGNGDRPGPGDVPGEGVADQTTESNGSETVDSGPLSGVTSNATVVPNASSGVDLVNDTTVDSAVNTMVLFRRAARTGTH